MENLNKETKLYLEYGLLPDLYRNDEISTMNLPYRAIHALSSHCCINNVCELLQYSISDLEKINNIGNVTIAEIIKYVKILADEAQTIGESYKRIQPPAKSTFRIHVNKDKILKGDFSFKEDFTFNNKELKLLDNYEMAIQVIGTDLISLCIEEPKNLRMINDLLNSLSKSLSGYSSRKKELLKEIQCIPEERKVKPAINFLNEYFFNNEIAKKFLRFYPNEKSSLDKIDIEKILLMPDEFNIMYEFFKWCSYDVIPNYLILRSKIYDNENDNMIIRMRAEGRKIPYIAKKMYFTPKEVSQCENKVLKRFNQNKTEYKRLISIINAEQFTELDWQTQFLFRNLKLFLEEMEYLRNLKKANHRTSNFLSKSIGKKIKFFRERYEFTELEFAEQVGISIKNLNDFENDIKFPSKNIIERISMIFDENPKVFQLEKEIIKKLTIGKKIKYLRENIGLSSYQFLKALKFPMSRSKLSSYEDDIILPTLNELQQFANFFNVDLKFFKLDKAIKNLSQGEKICFYRRSADFTQTELAKKANILNKRISDIETGKCTAKVFEIVLIAQALNIDYQILNLKKLSIGNRIEIYRGMTKLSQKDFGEKVGIPARKIYEYENNLQNPSYSDITSIAHYVNVEPTIISPTIKHFSNKFLVGEKINYYRIKNNLTRNELASKCNISVKHLRNIENNICLVKENELLTISNELNINIT